jgi:sulfofructose kinase
MTADTIRDRQTASPSKGRLDVVGLGYCSYDILAIVPEMPRFDTAWGVHLAELAYDGGGPVGTALATLSRLGAEAGYVGTLGDDREGRWLQELFVREGVDVSRLRMSPEVRTNTCLLLIEQATGRRAILCYPGVEPDSLVPDDTDRATIQSAKVLHLDGQFLPAAIQAAGWAQAAGVKVCFDGNHPRPGLDQLLPLVDWLIVAETFPQAYTGEASAERAAQLLLSLGPELLVTTHGQRGCESWVGTEHIRMPSFSVRAVDTTGAGDAFHGAFIYAMLQGWDLERSATFANAVAAINCRTLGGRRGLPTLAEVESFLEWH